MLDVVARYRELGCVDIPVSASKVEGGRARGYRVRACRLVWSWGLEPLALCILGFLFCTR